MTVDFTLLVRSGGAAVFALVVSVFALPASAAQSGNNHATLGLVSSPKYRRVIVLHDRIKNAELSQTAYESSAFDYLL